MNRTLKRPMFRMGGAAGTGITSGLDKPRQNYRTAGTVAPVPRDALMERAESMKPDILKMMFKKQFPNRSDEYVDNYVDNYLAGNTGTISDNIESKDMLQSKADTAVGGGTSLEEAIAIARAKAKEMTPSGGMTGSDFSSRFLIPFGLDLASRPPEGGLLATVAKSAKGPLEKFYKLSDTKAESLAKRESDLFNTFLAAGLEDRRFDKKQAAEKLKDSQQFLTLYDKEKEENVVVKAGDVYKDLERYGPAKADKDGRPFEKLEIAEKISDTMGKIFELTNKKDKTKEESQELKELETVLDYLRGSKNTKGFADSLLKDQNFIQDIRSRITKRYKETEEYKNMLESAGISAQESLIIQQKIDRFVNAYLETGMFPPELLLADGGRVEYQSGGDVMAAADTPKIDFDTLRARLPKEISDDIVRLIAASPEALEDFATIQTQQDVNNFNMKYDVELVLPAEA